MEVLAKIAFAAMAVLVAILAVYVAVRFLGKLAKFIIAIVVILLIVWFLFSQHSFLNVLQALPAPARLLQAAKGVRL